MKKITFVLTFLLSIFGYSQIISGEIFNQDKKPISGARIGVENTDFGYLSIKSILLELLLT